MSDYPMLISNKLHSFRNFFLQIYKILLHRAIIPVRMIQIKSELTEIQALSLCFVCNFIIANQNIIIAKRKMLIAKTNMLIDYFFHWDD